MSDNSGQFKKGQIPWNKGTKGLMKPNSGSFVKDDPRLLGNKITIGVEPWNKGIPYVQITDDKHFNWKGEKASYSAIHSWVRRKLGTPLECSECGRTGGTTRNYHWANLDKQYRRTLIDWRRLCVSCHKLYDLGRLELTNG